MDTSTRAVRSWFALAIAGTATLAALSIPSQADLCEQAVPIFPGRTLGTLTGATTISTPLSGCPFGHIGRWYVFTVGEPSFVTARLCNPQTGTGRFLVLSPTCPPVNVGTCTTSSSTCWERSEYVPAGPLYIGVTGLAGSSGPFELTLDVVPEASADQCADAVELQPLPDGRLNYWADLVAATNDGAAACDQTAAPADKWLRYTPDRDVMFTLGNPSFALTSIHTSCPGTPENAVFCHRLTSTATVRLNAGTSYFIRAARNSVAQAQVLFRASTLPATGPGYDVVVPRINVLRQLGRIGSTFSLAAESHMCNRGSEPISCRNNPDPRHPFIAMNLYKLDAVPDRPGATRLRQIGVSWAKHVFAAGYMNDCGYGCPSTGISSTFRPGCSDIYDTATNGDQARLGPRSEINPWTGQFDFASSLLNQPLPPQTAITRRMRLTDAEVNAFLNPGATLLSEVFIIVAEDEDHLNNVVHQRFYAAGFSGSVWSFTAPTPAIIGPAINSWTGAEMRTVPPDVGQGSADGRCIIAARATPNGDGTWHYEYAVYNHDMHRAVRSVVLPLRPGAVAAAPGCFSVAGADLEPGFHENPWTIDAAAGSVAWSTDDTAAPASNPLRWGTLNNYWFDSPHPPGPTRVALGLFRPAAGQPDVIEAIVTGPSLCPGDFDLRGTVTVQDIFEYLFAYFTADPRADLDGSGTVTLQDLFAYLVAYFSPC